MVVQNNPVDQATVDASAPSVYEALKAHGHSPAKAWEIILDAGRGDRRSQQWIAHIVGDDKSSTIVPSETSV